jgi:hypothetical protein
LHFRGEFEDAGAVGIAPQFHGELSVETLALPGQATSNVEVIDWGRGGPNEMITRNALMELRSAGRIG